MSHGDGEQAVLAHADVGDAAPPLTLRLPEAGLADLRLIRDFVGRGSRRLGADDECVADLIQAVDESATNIIRHGYHGSSGLLDIEIGRLGESVRVAVRDEAPAFDPRDWPEPDLEAPLETRRPGGFGVHLTRACVDRLEHSFLAPAGNQLTLFRRADSTAQEGLA